MWHSDGCIHSFFLFLSKVDRTLYTERILEIYQWRNLTAEARERLQEICTELVKKSMTDLGEKRKQTRTEKLFHTDSTTKLYLSRSLTHLK